MNSLELAVEMNVVRLVCCSTKPNSMQRPGSPSPLHTHITATLIHFQPWELIFLFFFFQSNSIFSIHYTGLSWSKEHAGTVGGWALSVTEIEPNGTAKMWTPRNIKPGRWQEEAQCSGRTLWDQSFCPLSFVERLSSSLGG